MTILQASQIATVQRYDRLSETYDRSHARWLRHAGGEAQCAFEGAAAALLRPGMRILDAACGTGTVARRLLAGVEGAAQLTLLDASPDMLTQCNDLQADRVQGRIEDLPFPNAYFDLVTCAWGIETIGDARLAIAEFVRVCRPGGHVCLVFCADRPVRSWLARVLRTAITRRGLGRFLDAASVMRAGAQCGAVMAQPLHCTGPAAAILLRC